jgi:asparagine synthase (glutamine-hydrolysing)
VCGLAGIVGRPSEGASDLIAACCSDLRHRGPDGRGQETVRLSAGEAVLGHTRLSIIDLDERGLQPMWSADRRFCLVYNGEVYNYRELRTRLEGLGHRFRTATDTEVLLAAWVEWGVAALPLLTGMFAFAVLDLERAQVTMVRDAFGIKPLYISVQEARLFFASELPALRRLLPNSPGLDQQTVFDYLRFGRYDTKRATFVSGIARLDAGHHATFDLTSGRLAPSIRWWWPDVTERKDLTFEQAAGEFRERFLDSVRLHLRSDVPLGAALSGGLDSSSIVSAMRQLEPDIPISTFSLVAPGTPTDEERWADLVNAHVGAVPHKVHLDAGSLRRDMDDMLLAQGEPFGSTSIYAQYRVYREFREAGVTVSLDGQGADELLAGYHGYPGMRIRSLLAEGRYGEAVAFLRNWFHWPGRTGRRAMLELGSALTPAAFRPLALRIVGEPQIPGWIARDEIGDLSVPWQSQATIVRGSGSRSLAALLRSELSGGGLDRLLRHGDRNSMRWSVESRVPFLTTDLAEFVLRLPEDYLVGRDGTTKRLLRTAMRGMLPDEIVNRRDKVGFEPAESALVLPVAADIEAWGHGLDVVPFVDAQSAISHVKRVIRRERLYTNLVWRFVCLGRWVQTEFGEST